jgi:hypothetical protein
MILTENLELSSFSMTFCHIGRTSVLGEEREIHPSEIFTSADEKLQKSIQNNA